MDTLAYWYLQAREIGYLQKSVALYGEILFILYSTPLSGMQLDYAITISNLAYAKFNLEYFSNITSETHWQLYPSIWRLAKVPDQVYQMYSDAINVCDQIGYTGIEIVNILEKDLSTRLFILNRNSSDVTDNNFKQAITQRLNRSFTILASNNQFTADVNSVEYAHILLLMAKYNGFLLTKLGFHDSDNKVLKQQTITAFDSVLECYLKVYGPYHPKYINALAFKSYAYGYHSEECTKFAIDAVPISMQYYGELFIEVLVYLYIVADRVSYKTFSMAYTSYRSPGLFQKSNEIRRRYGIKEEKNPY